MNQQSQKEIYEKIRSILRIKVFDIQSIKLETFNMHTFLFISSIYALVWIIIHCNPHMLYKFFAYNFYYHLKELFIAALDYMFWVYLPEMVIFIFDFTVKRFKLQNKNAVKTIRILIMILSYVYLILLGCLIVAISIGLRELFEEP